MMRAIGDYFVRLSDAFGHGWTRFWFTPSDATTVSAIRVGTGLVVLYLHATLSFDLVAFFGPNGLLPADEIRPLEGATLSYLNYLSSPAELWTVHLIGLAILVAFAVGWYTRLSSVLALIVFLSDVNRAPMITSITEPVAAMVLLYLCLAPCGRRFSLDALLARRSEDVRLLPASPAARLSTLATISTRLIQIHLALLVAMMGFSMLSGDAWWLGTGVWWLIARPESRLVDLSWLSSSPKLIDAWSHLIVLFELSFPILVWNRLARPLMLAWGVLVWSSLALVNGDITFAVMMCVAGVAFISPTAIESCVARLGRRPQSSTAPSAG